MAGRRAVAAAVAALSAVLLAPGLSQPHDVAGKRPSMLKIDQALLLIHNELHNEVLTVSWLSDYCHQCLYQYLGLVPMNNTSGKPQVEVAVDAQHPVTLQLNGTSDGKELCKFVAGLKMTC